MTKKILIVEDEPDIADVIAIHLSDLGYRTEIASSGADALDRVERDGFSLVVLDIMLPEMDGFEVCKRIRARDRRIPILVLSARTEEVDRILGLELGADAYMTKPFSIRELGARVKSIYRRIEVDREESAPMGEHFSFGALEANTTKRLVIRSGQPVDLTAKEFDLLVTFMRHPGKVFTRSELLELVWGYEYEGYSHTVNSHINRLRRKIEDTPADPRLIQTVWGVGYRFGPAI